MKTKLLMMALQYVISQIDPQTVKELIDDWLDIVEDRYASNVAIMNSLAVVRGILSIPDDIGGDED